VTMVASISTFPPLKYAVPSEAVEYAKRKTAVAMAR